MKQTRLTTNPPKVNYSYGPYNVIKEDTQRIRISEGCPHNCPWCYEPTEYKVFDIPKIERNIVEISDMNLLSKPEALRIIKELGNIKVNGKVVYYELICGIDYRFLTLEIAQALKKSRFKKIRLAWDWGMKQQYQFKEAVDLLKKVGYKGNNIMVFMLCNWKIPYEICCNKLDLLKIWNVQVADCWFDNQTFPKVIPLHWNDEQLNKFRKKCRKHNQMVNFGIDPEILRNQSKVARTSNGERSRKFHSRLSQPITLT